MSHLAWDVARMGHIADVRCPQQKPISAKRCSRILTHCSQAQRYQETCDEREKLAEALRTVAFVAATSCALAPWEAYAWDHGWKPRRHHRRMTERSIDVKHFFQVKEPTDSRLKQIKQKGDNAFSEGQMLAKDVQQALHKVLTQAPRQREIHMSESARPTAPSHSGSRQNTAGPLGWLAVVVAAAGLLWLIFGKAVSAALARWGQGGKKGGKWVSDRSLGGKMVWMPDEPKATSTSGRSQGFRWNDAPSSAGAVLTPDDLESASTSGRQAPGGPQGPQQKGPPSWWDSPPTIHVDQRYKDQTSSQARTILRQMEDGKLLSGQDYSTSALVSLRQTCADSGAVVKAQTPSGGDAIYRAGVEAAASAAMEGGQGGSLGGSAPQRFVSGLAHDLGLADDKAGGMAVAVIAARLRSTLIDAAASYRQRDEFEVLNQLVRIVGVLDKFPLPSKSAEADMIATAVQQRATLEERQALFFTYGGMEPRTASTVAEMLGFNPDLVMPQLQRELDAAQQTNSS